MRDSTNELTNGEAKADLETKAETIVEIINRLRQSKNIRCDTDNITRHLAKELSIDEANAKTILKQCVSHLLIYKMHQGGNRQYHDPRSLRAHANRKIKITTDACDLTKTVIRVVKELVDPADDTTYISRTHVESAIKCTFNIVFETGANEKHLFDAIAAGLDKAVSTRQLACGEKSYKFVTGDAHPPVDRSPLTNGSATVEHYVDEINDTTIKELNSLTDSLSSKFMPTTSQRRRTSATNARQSATKQTSPTTARKSQSTPMKASSSKQLHVDTEGDDVKVEMKHSSPISIASSMSRSVIGLNDSLSTFFKPTSGPRRRAGHSAENVTPVKDEGDRKMSPPSKRKASKAKAEEHHICGPSVSTPHVELDIESPLKLSANDQKYFKQAHEHAQQMCSLTSSDSTVTPEFVEIGPTRLKCWYSAPYPQEVAVRQTLYLCPQCLGYFNSAHRLAHHRRKCRLEHPPGHEIYRDEDVRVFEIDGDENRIYCQNLCLLAKLFLDHKTLFMDVDKFLFYVLVVVEPNDNSRFVGYFSKEKYSATRYNLSCIVTLPCFQRKGFGRFLIDFSYLLSRVEETPGTPERPLSLFGALSYNAYWRSVLIEYLHARGKSSVKLSLRSISKTLGIVPKDVADTLHALKILAKDDKTMTFHINRAWLQDAKDKLKPARKAKRENLRWKPITYSPPKSIQSPANSSMRSPMSPILMAANDKDIKVNKSLFEEPIILPPINKTQPKKGIKRKDKAADLLKAARSRQNKAGPPARKKARKAPVALSPPKMLPLAGRRGAAIQATRQIERVKYMDTATDDDDGRDIISSDDDETEATTAEESDENGVELAIDSSQPSSESEEDEENNTKRRATPSARNSCKPSSEFDFIFSQYFPASSRKRDAPPTSSDSDNDRGEDGDPPPTTDRQRRSTSRRAPVEKKENDVGGGEGKRRRRQRKRASNRQPLIMERREVSRSCTPVQMPASTSISESIPVASPSSLPQLDTSKSMEPSKSPPSLVHSPLPSVHQDEDDEKASQCSSDAPPCLHPMPHLTTNAQQVTTPVAQRSVAVDDRKEDCPPPLSPMFGGVEETVAKDPLAEDHLTLVEPCDTRQMGNDVLAKVIKKFPTAPTITASVDPIMTTPLSHRSKQATAAVKKTPKKRASAGSAATEKMTTNNELKSKSISPEKLAQTVSTSDMVNMGGSCDDGSMPLAIPHYDTNPYPTTAQLPATVSTVISPPSCAQGSYQKPPQSHQPRAKPAPATKAASSKRSTSSKKTAPIAAHAAPTEQDMMTWWQSGMNMNGYPAADYANMQSMWNIYGMPQAWAPGMTNAYPSVPPIDPSAYTYAAQTPAIPSAQYPTAYSGWPTYPFMQPPTAPSSSTASTAYPDFNMMYGGMNPHQNNAYH